ncbi:hypothetical protein EGW08_013211, partial [Elysia chlorotica]
RWDEALASQASDWAERCEYRRPGRDRSGYRLNANLYLAKDHVYGNRSVHRMVNKAIEAWWRSKERYDFSSHCGRACSYVQMIQARTDRIGCGMSLCQNVLAGNLVVEYASMLVCYYYPGENLLNTYPYVRGTSCSRCPSGMDCRDRLCRIPGAEIVPADLYPGNFRTRPQAIREYRDKLTREEEVALTDSHNKMREGNRLGTSLRWDPFLQRWAEWIIHCEVDYPGPNSTYTNFVRLDQGTDVYNVVSKWSEEGYNTNLRMEHGCRTPPGESRCNHFTNLLGQSLTTMGCAARDCGEGTRQLVCLYDNMAERPSRRRATSTRVDPFAIRRRPDPRPRPRRYDPRIDGPRSYETRVEGRRYDPRTETRYDMELRRANEEAERRRLYEERRRAEEQRRLYEERKKAEEEQRRREYEERKRAEEEQRRREYEERKRAEKEQRRREYEARWVNEARWRDQGRA